MAIPEVRRGDFIYRDTLFVDLGENKRHPRASASDIKDLLLPKKGIGAAKDQVAHWYEAQLMHYGLQRSKDKNTAKVRLTNAITTKTLAVPAHIAQMEADMKKEHAAASRKVKAATKKAQDTSATDKPATKAQKRKADDSAAGSTTKISVKVGDATLEISQQTGSAKKRKMTGESPPRKPTIKAKAATTGSATKPKRAKVSTTRPAASPSPSQSSAPTTASPPRAKQTARRSRPFVYGQSTRNLPSGSQQIHAETPASFYENDIDMDEAPPAYDSIDFNHYDEPPNNRGVVQISGSYDIYVRLLSTRSDLSLRIDKVDQKLWGRFSIGTKNGIIHADDISGIADGRTVSFGWRAEDDETGDMRFGRGCNGSMEFDVQGHVRGRLFGLMRGQDIDFEGRFQDEDGPDVEDLRYQWNRFPQIAYGRSRG